MKNRMLLVLSLVGIMVLAACNTQPNALPTVQSFPTEAPPTATFTPAPDQPTATATRSLARPTLPPTWTPVPTETASPTPTEVFPTATFFNPPPTLPAGCASFVVDFASNTTAFPAGTAPTVRWIAAEGAVRYRLKLVEVPSNRVIAEDIYIAETSYQFPADFFEAGKLYGWEVYPINERGDQMCFQVGEALQPYRP